MGVLKTEPAMVAAAEAAAVATAGADNNQQRAAKTAAAALAAGKRCQAKGEHDKSHDKRRHKILRNNVGGSSGGGGDGSGGGNGGGERPEVRVDIGVPRILLGGYLAPRRAMFLANTYMERSQCLASRQSFICAADIFICSHR